jgi:glycosyltransferase involved in cell wall biosynthesis
MKILIAHNQYTEPGGEDKIVEAEQALLASHGHDVKVYTRSNGELSGKTFFDKVKFAYQDVFFSKKTYYEVAELMKTFQPDIVHVHNIFVMISPAIYDICWDREVPVVQTIHNYRFFCSNGLFFRSGQVCEDCLTVGPISALKHRCWRQSILASGLMTKVQRKLREDYFPTEKIARFIVPSEFTRKKCVACGLPEEKITVKPHFSQNQLSGDRDVRKYAVFIGRLIDYKGIDLLLNVFQDLPEIPLKIVGDGPLKPEVERVVAEQGHVSFLGRQSSEEVGRILSKAAFIICPSPCYETFGRVVIEAFSQGTPALVSRGGALEELISQPYLGAVVQENDARHFRAAAKDLWQTVQREGPRVKDIQDVFTRRFTAEVNYQALLAVYDNVLQNRTT